MAFRTSRAAVAAVAALFASGALGGSPVTCSSPQLSCQNTTAVENTCCFNAPGGQLVQTQFWDTSPSTGPATSWTIHGLWPDHCDGTYDSTCDSSRAYKNISAILTAAGKTDLVDYMNEYWVDINGQDETFWEHEWAKHGTCISTLEPNCYTSYTPTQEVPDFFQKSVDLFKTLDSYKILSDAGIVPSTSKTYTSAEIQAAFTKSSFGFPATIQCSSGALNEIWYSFNMRGSIQSGDFVPVAPSGSTSDCPSTGIKYLPKSTGSEPTTTPGGTTLTTVTTSQGPAPTGVFSGSGYLNAYTGGSQTGCLISAGTWYTTGTCASFTATASGSGFTLKSSKGSCGISNSAFTCGSGITATVFGASNNELAYNGNTNFYASAVPSGSTQQAVSTKAGGVTVTFQWKSK